jgi:Uncharacterized protein conserved in bacteria
MQSDSIRAVYSLTRSIALFLLVVSLTACQHLASIRNAWWLGHSGVNTGASTPQKLAPVKPPPRTDTYPLRADSDRVGELHVVTARHADTLLDIARRYDLGYNEITDANPGVDPWLPGEGTPVLLPTQFLLPDAPRKGVVLNLAAMRLFYYPEPKPGEAPVVITHPTGIGRENWPTPRGLTRVTKKVVNPVWHVPTSIQAEHAAAGDPLPAVVPPGPDNPLGRYAMRLDIPGYLIHGTNKPAGIGMRISHGCVQLYPEDIETLFDQVPIGTEVRIVNQPYLAGWHEGTLYLEAHKPLTEQNHALNESLNPIVRVVEKAIKNTANSATSVDWEKAQRLARLGYGIPVAISPGTPDLNELLAAVPVYETPPELKPAAESNDSTAPADRARWYVQAGSFKMAENAKKLAAMLNHLGPPISARYVSSDGYHRVLAGPFATRGEAEVSANRIESSLGIEAVILD